MWLAVCDHLRGSDDERMAYLLARAARWDHPWDGPMMDLLAVRAVLVPDSALTDQSGASVTVAGWLTRELLIACYETGLSLIDVHTHPFAGTSVAFSAHDVENMRETHTEFLTRMPDAPPRGVASLVVGRTAVAGAFTDPDELALRPLSTLVLLGDDLGEVPLCHR
jgi:hypothetical protein